MIPTKFWPALAIPFLSFGCGGGSSGGSVTGSSIDLPTEISAVSATEDTGSALVQPVSVAPSGLAATLEGFNIVAQADVANLPADCDYNNDISKKFIYIKVLDVFSIIETIFDAVKQTNWEDHIGDGAYRAMISFKDNNNGQDVEKLEEWTIRSQLGADDDGDGIADSNILDFWIDDENEGMEIKCRIEIEEAPTQDEAGLMVTLGRWTIKANFDETGDQYFMAQAEPQGDGVTTKLTVQQIEQQAGHISQMRAVIFRSMDDGYGIVEMPNFDACFGMGGCPGGPTMETISFVYNENYLTVRQADSTEISFDRTDEHEVCDYMLYDATTGERLTASHSWGFPVRPQGGGFGNYYSWQGLHQLFLGGEEVADDDVFVRADTPPGETPPTYTAEVFDGHLVKSTMVAGDISLLEDIPAQVFLFKNYNLKYSSGSGSWLQCADFDCSSTSAFLDWNELEYNGADDQRQIDIADWTDPGNPLNYVYLSAANASGQGAGFFLASPVSGSSGPPKWQANSPLNKLSPVNNQQLFVMVGGQAYIEYTGTFNGSTTPSGWGAATGWVMKEVSDFDFTSWTPTFDESGDVAYPFGLNDFVSIHTNSASYQVTRIATNGNANDYTVLVESRLVCNPESTSVFPTDELVDPNVADSSVYELDTNPASPTYMMLVFDTPNDSDANNGYSAGELVDRDLYGLKLQSDVSSFGAGSIRFSWTYAGESDPWGQQIMLKDASNDWVVLDNPISLQSKQLATTNDIVNNIASGSWLSYKCFFDGRLNGLYDMIWELEKVGWDADKFPEILPKNVRVPDGTEFTDADDPSKTYFCKATVVKILLGYVTAFPLGAPDISLATSLSLDSELPTVSGLPTTAEPDEDSTELLYIEGNPVE